jgi:cytochrome c oxidase subunit III
MVTRYAVAVDVPPGRRPEVRLPGRQGPPAPPPFGGDDEKPDQDPERRPPLLDNARLATLFLIAAESMLFGGLITGFFMLRIAAAVWPPPMQPRLPVAATAANTLVLLASSVAMLAARRALRANDLRGLPRWLAGTAALGALFVTVQGYEWARLVGFGLTVSSGAYGGTFYTLIGAHAVHVICALAWVLVTLGLVYRGRVSVDRAGVFGACEMYWHFVVLLWPILYVSVYLL